MKKTDRKIKTVDSYIIEHNPSNKNKWSNDRQTLHWVKEDYTIHFIWSVRTDKLISRCGTGIE